MPAKQLLASITMPAVLPCSLSHISLTSSCAAFHDALCSTQFTPAELGVTITPHLTIESVEEPPKRCDTNPILTRAMWLAVTDPQLLRTCTSQPS